MNNAAKTSQADRVTYNLNRFRYPTRESALLDIEELFSAHNLTANELSRLEGLVDETYPE